MRIKTKAKKMQDLINNNVANIFNQIYHERTYDECINIYVCGWIHRRIIFEINYIYLLTLMQREDVDDIYKRACSLPSFSVSFSDIEHLGQLIMDKAAMRCDEMRELNKQYLTLQIRSVWGSDDDVKRYNSFVIDHDFFHIKKYVYQNDSLI